MDVSLGRIGPYAHHLDISPANCSRRPEISCLGAIRFHRISTGAVSLSARNLKSPVTVAFKAQAECLHQVYGQIHIRSGHRAAGDPNLEPVLRAGRDE